jgi:hypothetical protein
MFCFLLLYRCAVYIPVITSVVSLVTELIKVLRLKELLRTDTVGFLLTYALSPGGGGNS